MPKKITATQEVTFPRSRIFWLISSVSHLFSTSSVCSGRKPSQKAACISLLIHLLHAKSFFFLMKNSSLTKKCQMIYFPLEVSQICILDFLPNVVHLYQVQLPISPHHDTGFFFSTAPLPFKSPKNIKRNLFD